jgi:hypothetical protein
MLSLVRVRATTKRASRYLEAFLQRSTVVRARERDLWLR